MDADVGNSTIGPPACAGVAVLESQSDLDTMDTADRLHFVGSVTPDRLVLQHVIATASLAEYGRRAADLVIVDTTGAISGVTRRNAEVPQGGTDPTRPGVALQRGGELEPVIGMLRRFLAADVVTLPADPDVNPVGPDQRADSPRRQLRNRFRAPTRSVAGAADGVRTDTSSGPRPGAARWRSGRCPGRRGPLSRIGQARVRRRDPQGDDARRRGHAGICVSALFASTWTRS